MLAPANWSIWEMIGRLDLSLYGPRLQLWRGALAETTQLRSC